MKLQRGLEGCPCQILVRLRAGRRFYADPSLAGPPAHTGRPRRHGPKMKCKDPSTWPEPSAQYACEDSAYGAVRVRAFSKIHPKVCAHEGRGSRGPLPIVVGTLVLVEVERLPRGERRRKPRVLWLWWHGPEGEAPNLELIWRAYVRRFDLEHTFRFLKEALGWSTPRVRHPEQADRWTWLVLAAFTQLRLARAARSGHKAALGAPLRHCPPYTGAGPSRSFSAFGRARHARQAAETLWTLSGAAQRTALGPGETLSGSQEDRLNPHEDSGRGSFARGFISIAKLLVLKTQA